MRKYYRLSLLIVTLFSLFLFLVYRHQYNRLHYVLEVFDFFGQPCNYSDLERRENILDHHDWGPIPLWKESDKIYFYSAFWTHQNQVKAIAAVPTNNSGANSCFLWYEDKRKPFLGRFKHTVRGKDAANTVNLFFYYCESKSGSLAVPYAASFSANHKYIEAKKILLTNNLYYQTNYNLTVCVPPGNFNKTKLVEFLSFHRLIGVNSFIFYGGSIPHRVSKLISNLAFRLDMHVSFLPWNFPYTDKELILQIVDVDCMLRNRNQSHFVTVLETDEYIVPGYNTSLLETLSRIEQKVYRISFPLIKFCLESAKPDKPMALQNVQLLNSKIPAVADIYRVNMQSSATVHDVNVQEFDKSFAAVYKYVHCNGKAVKSGVDSSILRFSSDFIRTALVQMLRNDML